MRGPLIIILILVLGAALRLAQLGSKSLWFDEAFTVNFSNYPLDVIWQPNFSRPETHPPLYYHGLHYWMITFGSSETSIRLPSALISTANIALIYLLGRRLFSQRVGLLSALLLAVSPLHIWYAQEARQSVFMTAVLLLSAVLLTWDSWWALPPLALTFAVGLYIDYTMLPIWSLLTALWFVAWRQQGQPRRPFLIWFLASSIAWLVYLPWLDDFYAFLEIFSTLHLFIRLNETFGLPILTPGQYLAVMLVGAAIMIPAVIATQALLQSKRTRRWLIPLILLGYILVTILVPVPRLYSLKRVLVQIWPLVILLTAWAIAQLGNWRMRTTWIILATSLAASLFALTVVPKDDWRGAVAYVNNHAAADDMAWVDPDYNRMPVNYYDLKLPLETESGAQVPAEFDGEIWFLATRFPGQPIPSSPTEQLLDSQLGLIEAIPFYRLEVRRYRTTAQ